MKIVHFTLCLLFLGFAVADVPKKHSLNRYVRLWTDSPFTTKPIIERTKVDGWEKDWVLAGISQMSNGDYFVTVMNKKDRSIRARMDTSGKESVESGAEGFTVTEVEVDSRDFLKSKAFVYFKGEGKWLSFDESSTQTVTSAPRPSPTVKPNTNNQTRTLPEALLNRNSNNNSNKTTTTTRPRRIIPVKRN